MAQERSEALVLRGMDFSETSRIVTFLTPERGRLTCMAKGVKRPRNQLSALLDTFNRLEIIFYWKESRNVQQLGDASLINGFPGLKGDLDKSVYAALPLELVYKVARDNEPSHELYTTLVHGLDEMDEKAGDARTGCCRLLLRLLSVAGFAPSLDVCCECGRDVPESPGFRYDGGVVCAQCPSDRRISAADYEVLLALAGNASSDSSVTASRDVLDTLRRFASRQIESDLKSARVIEQMFK